MLRGISNRADDDECGYRDQRSSKCGKETGMDAGVTRREGRTELLPAGQATQSLSASLPVDDRKVPLGHACLSLDPPGQVNPAGHCSLDVDPGGQ